MNDSNSQSTHHQQPSVLLPNAILTANRYELTNLAINIEGDLPDDLQGYFFMVAPVGSVDSGGLPYPSDNSLLNGDGMIYRLDFDEPNQVKVTSRLAKPADYYADLATRSGSEYSQYGFRNHGISRFSISLGLRNELNTAFLPMPFAASANTQHRLLITYDTGRHYELDTETLETVTPIGSNQEWRSEVDGINFPFPPFLSTAHPVFDAYTEEMFTVNYGRSVENFLKTLPLTLQLQELPQEIEEFVGAVTGFFSAELIRKLLNTFYGLFDQFSDQIAETIETISGIELENFVYLIRWNGQSYLERWKVVLPDGSPVKIKQTMHQIGLSQDYIVLMDTAFVTGVQQVINNPIPEYKKLERLLREILQRPANPDSLIYIIRRRDLQRGEYPALGESEVKVVAQQLTIPMEAAHFLMDYENPNGKITLHIAHICAWNVAEWIRRYDVSIDEDHSPTPEQVQAMETNATDIGRLGRYVIDAENTEKIESQIISESPYTWGNGLYAYLDRLPSGFPPSRLDNIYWTSFGIWPELVTDYAIRVYDDYKYRAISIPKFLELAKERVPSCLLRVDTTTMTIADSYQMPIGMIISSPQFIPRQGSQGDSTDGYLLCTVYRENRNEFWLFDGKHLSKGPLCKLSHPSLNFGFTLHTTWLPTIGPREASYQIPVTSDYQPLINQQRDPMIQKLFYEKIYPMFSNHSQE